MLYRRTPRNPPTLLLRIVASAGAGTLIGMASCGGSTSTANGTIALPESEAMDAQGDATGVIAVGSTACPGSCGGTIGIPEDDASEPVGVAPCSPCGVVVGLVDGGEPDGSGSFPDASVADVEVHGVVPLPEDAGPDAHRVGLMGSVVEPPDADKTTCPPLCGVVIGLSPNPGH